RRRFLRRLLGGGRLLLRRRLLRRLGPERRGLGVDVGHVGNVGQRDVLPGVLGRHQLVAEPLIELVLVLVVVLLGLLGLFLARPAAAPGRTAQPARRPGRGFAPAATLELVVGEPRQHDGHVARALADAGAPPAGAGPPPLERWALVGVGAGDEQLVLGQALVALGVGDGRVE